MILRGTTTKKKEMAIFLLGMCVFILAWQIVSWLAIISPLLLPSPMEVVNSVKAVYFDHALTRNAFYSISLNVLGLVEAFALAFPLGLALGLFSPLRALFRKPIEASRFIPLPALTGLFISMFGIQDNMKVQFLAFSIFVFLLPAVIGRVDEVNEIYVQTMQTLKASTWQTIRHVFVPYALSRSFIDLIVMSAISWTYITIAETIRLNDGGLGAMTYLFFRQSKVAMGFLALVSILIIGTVSDKLLYTLDRLFFPYKYSGSKG